MTATAESVLPTEQDELAELASIGIVLDGPTTDAQLDAAASEICRRLGEAQAELDRFEEAESAEVARIEMRYMALCEPIEKRIAQLEELGREIARRADFGKKKSRAVGFGSYGRKTKREHVKIVDEAAAIAFARECAIPGGVKVETVEKPVHKAIEPVVIAHVHATGEVPAGFEHEAERDEPFVKAQ
jgi:phage host-nuclease inhibitor protein Gam